MQTPLKPEKIASKLQTDIIGKKVVMFASTASTNDIAAKYAGTPSNNGLVVFAEQQTAGRGRSGATWFSEPGKALLFSVLIKSQNLTSQAVSLAAAVAVAEAIGKLGRYWARIKWPNDILINRKKIAGILVESRSIKESTWYVIGVGINCNYSEAEIPEELKDIATSYMLCAGCVCDRTSLARRVLSSMDAWMQTASTDITEVVAAWKHSSVQLGQRIFIEYNRKTFSGNCIGIDPDKGLIVQLDRGGVRMFDAAQSSIAKLQERKKV